MIEDRIDVLIEKYMKCIKDDLLIIGNDRRVINNKSDDYSEFYKELCLIDIFEKEKEIELVKDFIRSMEYAKTGEFND